jgi:hypothetical protein
VIDGVVQETGKQKEEEKQKEKQEIHEEVKKKEGGNIYNVLAVGKWKVLNTPTQILSQLSVRFSP